MKLKERLRNEQAKMTIVIDQIDKLEKEYSLICELQKGLIEEHAKKHGYGYEWNKDPDVMEINKDGDQNRKTDWKLREIYKDFVPVAESDYEERFGTEDFLKSIVKFIKYILKED